MMRIGWGNIEDGVDGQESVADDEGEEGNV